MKELKKIMLKSGQCDSLTANTQQTTGNGLNNNPSTGNLEGSGSGGSGSGGSGSGSGDDHGGVKIYSGSQDATIGISNIQASIVVSWTEGSVTGVPVQSNLSVRIIRTSYEFPVHDCDDPSISGLFWEQGYIAKFEAVYCWGEYKLDEDGKIEYDEDGNPIILRKNRAKTQRVECHVIPIENDTSGNSL